MIRSSMQLKALVRNMAQGDSTKAQIIRRHYVMGRFLERVSLSPYRANLVLKGGALIAAMVGLERRSTLDLDATIQNWPLSIEEAQAMVLEIISVTLDDGVHFEITDISTIMDESDYSGVRIMLDTTLETTHTPLRIDFSTGDILTPNEIEFSYPLLFEDRSIPILAYNLETVLGEKIETVLARGVANTRARDFYDLYALESIYGNVIRADLLRDALANTSRKRGSLEVVAAASSTLQEIRDSDSLLALWQGYQAKYDYAAEVGWDSVVDAILRLFDLME